MSGDPREVLRNVSKQVADQLYVRFLEELAKPADEQMSLSLFMHAMLHQAVMYGFVAGLKLSDNDAAMEVITREMVKLGAEIVETENGFGFHNSKENAAAARARMEGGK